MRRKDGSLRLLKENGFDHFVFNHFREKCKKNRARNQITKMWSWTRGVNSGVAALPSMLFGG
jgi:hypothetical protein